MAIERLNFGAVERLAETAFALRLQPQAINIASDPRLAIPTIPVATLASTVLRQIEEHLIVGHPAMLATQIVLAGGRHRLRTPETIGKMIAGGSGCGLVAGGRSVPTLAPP